jgi:hypothetical protein
MRIQLAPLLSYYRNSLADADRMAPDDAWLETASIVQTAEWATGQLSTATLSAIWSTTSGTGKGEVDDFGRKRFWLCPFVGRLKPEHGAKRHALPARLVPLWYPVRVSESGIVEPDSQLLPWIPRTLLEPVYPVRMVLGQLADSDTFYGAHAWDDPDAGPDDTPNVHKESRMQAWLTYGQQLLEFVSGKAWGDFSLEEYHKEPHAIVLPSGAPSARISGLLAFYDALIRDRISTPPLQRFVDGTVFPDHDPLAIIDDPRALHIAHFPTRPPLSKDQRSAMHSALVHHPDMLALNGPPGTGKTQWVAEHALQAWVEAALKGATSPPIQLWLAGTNQAIRASLETLQAGLLDLRWGYPAIKGLGIWCAAKSQRREIQLLREDWLGFKWVDGLPEGSPAEWGSEEQVIEGIENYVSNARRHFGRHVELVDAKNLVLAELRKAVDPLRTTWRLLRRDKMRKQAAMSLLEKAQWPTGFEEYFNHTQALLARRRMALSRISYISDEWQAHLDRTPLWLTFTASLPGATQRMARRNREFFTRFKLLLRGADMSDPLNVSAAIARLVRDVSSLCNATEVECSTARTIRKEKETVGQAWIALSESWSETPRWHDDGTIDVSWEHRCDSIHRSHATMWALRYWEAVFFEKRVAYYLRSKQQRQRSRLDGWSELACLTPMFAATVHSAPRFFQDGYGDDNSRPLYGFAERVVMEESSQISPEVAAGLLALARSAIMVGDEKQLAPVWGVPEKTDIGNLLQHGLIDSVEGAIAWRHGELMASSGSALKRANLVGLSVNLNEQHRSHPDLVAFANRLAYDNRIIPTRTDNDPTFPAFSYGHVVGQSDTQLGSKSNKIEAIAIALFLKDNSQKIKERYRVSRLADAIGLITPFVRQAQILRQELQLRLPVNDLPQIGTVHAYQGAEKPIILFSSVQSVAVGQENAFFDSDPSILNVAVSRARDSFWFIGNMNGLNPKSLRPSSILSQSLVKGQHQRIPNWNLPVLNTHGLNAAHIVCLNEKERDAILLQFVDDVQGVLHIASPWIDAEVLERLRFWQHAHAATQRGAQIIIHTNRVMMTYHGNSVVTDIQRSASLAGVRWEFHPSLFDSRIWDANRLGESSEPWLASLAGGNVQMFTGAVSWWATSQMLTWGTAKTATTFGGRY